MNKFLCFIHFLSKLFPWIGVEKQIRVLLWETSTWNVQTHKPSHTHTQPRTCTHKQEAVGSSLIPRFSHFWYTFTRCIRLLYFFPCILTQSESRQSIICYFRYRSRPCRRQSNIHQQNTWLSYLSLPASVLCKEVLGRTERLPLYNPPPQKKKIQGVIKIIKDLAKHCYPVPSSGIHPKNKRPRLFDLHHVRCLCVERWDGRRRL